MDGDKEVVYGEFIWWIGIWVLMSTVDGADQCSFWSTKNVNVFDGAPFHLTPFMSCRQFEKILYNLGYTNDTIPTRNGRELSEIWVSKVGTNF